MNKTQVTIVDRLSGKYGTGSMRDGWTLCNGVLTLQNLNDGKQAHQLANKRPNEYTTEQVSFRLVKIRRLS